MPGKITIEIEHLSAESENSNKKQDKEDILCVGEEPKPEIGSHVTGPLS
jgi:hypothetical protein